ncbi:GNAT family N-acetyltransferase [Streptomyces sp. NPDC006879]|uniref:GNAT family N-acetyltransferase n=1 Tax=Streptomyces sp. NPDC006879 TaxID=3364767 RepID=UPI0036C0861F
MTIASLPLEPSDAAVDAWAAVLHAAHTHDLPPSVPPPGRVEAAGRLRVPPARGRHVHLVAASEGDATHGPYDGVASVLLFTDPGNAHAAHLDTLTVTPRARRQGVGTALWERVRGELLADHRTSVSVELALGGPGEDFATSLGFTPVLPMAWYVQEVPGATGPSRLPDPYRLVSWPGIVPDEYATAAAVAHAAMDDAPTGDLDERPPTWDAERLRSAERLILARGGRMLTVAALDPAGEVAAYTELVLPDPQGPRALQYDTVVVPAHRGRGLGRAVKERARAELAAHHPTVQEIATTVADENQPMRAVNEALGYRWERPAAVFQVKL